jgi:hypothetical protein
MQLINYKKAENREWEPFNNVRRGGPKEKRLYATALVGEYDKPYHQPMLTRSEVGDIVQKTRTAPVVEKVDDYEPFRGVRIGGPKEKRLYKVAMMNEYDNVERPGREMYSDDKIKAALARSSGKKDMRPFRVNDIQEYAELDRHPFHHVRRNGPKEVRLLAKCLPGELAVKPDYEFKLDKDSVANMTRKFKDQQTSHQRKVNRLAKAKNNDRELVAGTQPGQRSIVL